MNHTMHTTKTTQTSLDETMPPGGDSMKFARHAFAFAVLAALVASLGGCAQDVSEIDRVQPNVTKKSDILGREYYLQSTTVETQFTGAYTFPGEKSSLVRGVFEIQEKTLLFFRTYEFMEGSEVLGLKGDTDVPMVDADGHALQHASLQDYQQIRCTPETQGDDCSVGSWCATAAASGLVDEASHAGFCVRKTTRYVFKGAPMMAYPITSHFDIRQDYHPGTGEAINVKVENTTDRLWFERAYMRVAWGAGAAMSAEADVTFGPLKSASVGVTLYEGDTAPEGEQFETGFEAKTGVVNNDGKGQHWLTFINRMILTAPTTYLEGYGEIPICFFYPWYTGGVYDCNSEEFKVRSFFLEVPKFDAADRAYVARDTDDVEFEKFGYFRSERLHYDLQFGSNFSGAIRRLQRHRVWDRYVKKLEDDGKGGQVWKGDFDYSKMNPVPIVYYANEEHPRGLMDESILIAKSWSEPFSDAVAHHTGDCGAQTDAAAYAKCLDDNRPAFPMFILCENSDAKAAEAKAAGYTVENGEVAEHTGTANGKFCRNMDTAHQFGDLRYSAMHAVASPVQVGLYGYGPSASDPLTGETIAGFAHSYTSAMKRGAERAMETIEFHAGVKDFNDIKRGSEDEFLMEAKALVHYGNKGPKTTIEAQASVKDLLDPDVRQRLVNEGLQKTDSAGTWAASRMATLKQMPEVDAKLLTGGGNWVHALFRDPRGMTDAAAALTEDQLETMSLANWAHIAGLRKREKLFREMAQENLYLEQFADNAVLGLSQEYGQRFDTALCEAFATTTTPSVFNWDEYVTAWTKNGSGPTSCTEAEAGTFVSGGLGQGRVCKKTGDTFQWASCSSRRLMQSLRIAVAVAEGMHPYAEQNQFLPSPLYSDTTDPIVRATQDLGREIVLGLRGEIKEELWGRIYKGTQEHEVGHTLGLRHNFEASTDAMNYHREYWDLKADAMGDVVNPWQGDTQAQSLGHIRTWQLASVMDYTAKFNGRFAGLGLYDKAAIKFGYGDLVDVFDTPPALDKSPGEDLAAMNAYLASPGDEDPAASALVSFGPQAMLKINRRLHYSTLPKYFGSVDNIYARRSVSWSKFKGDRCEADGDCSGGAICAKIGPDRYCSATDAVEVPYRFCSDEYNGMTPTCSTFDEGADPLEIARNSLDNYENYWYFYGYARDSETYHPERYAGAVESYLYAAARQYQYWMIDLATYQKGNWWSDKYGIDYDLDPNGGLSGALATSITFNKLANVIARPTPGYYGWNGDRLRFEPIAYQEQSKYSDIHHFNEEDGARPLYPGYSDGYLYHAVSGGQIYDRLAAFVLLADPTPPFYFGHNEDEDIQRYLVSFFNAFPRQVMQLFGGVAVEDAEFYGWSVLNGGNAQTDFFASRSWVGADSKAAPAACDPDVPDAQEGACRKYRIFPDGRPVFPTSRFRMPLIASIYGMSLLTQGFDRSYMDVSRIFLKGNQAEIELPAGVTLCTFTDPLSGKTYISPQVTEELFAPGCRMVHQAQVELDAFKGSIGTLQENYLFSEYQFRVSLLDIVRTMHEQFEY